MNVPTLATGTRRPVQSTGAVFQDALESLLSSAHTFGARTNLAELTLRGDEVSVSVNGRAVGFLAPDHAQDLLPLLQRFAEEDIPALAEAEVEDAGGYGMLTSMVLSCDPQPTLAAVPTTGRVGPERRNTVILRGNQKDRRLTWVWLVVLVIAALFALGVAAVYLPGFEEVLTRLSGS